MHIYKTMLSAEEAGLLRIHIYLVLFLLCCSWIIRKDAQQLVSCGQLLRFAQAYRPGASGHFPPATSGVTSALQEPGRCGPRAADTGQAGQPRGAALLTSPLSPSRAACGSSPAPAQDGTVWRKSAKRQTKCSPSRARRGSTPVCPRAPLTWGGGSPAGWKTSCSPRSCHPDRLLPPPTWDAWAPPWLQGGTRGPSCFGPVDRSFSVFPIDIKMYFFSFCLFKFFALYTLKV